jgi:ATP-dependent DNA ligase
MSLRVRTRPGLGIIEPCLPSPAEHPPSGPGWLHEIKHDGLETLMGVSARALDKKDDPE